MPRDEIKVTDNYVSMVARLNAWLYALEIGQNSGVVGFIDKAAMDADLNHADKTVAYVGNDPVKSNIGYWRKNGAEGEGSWVQASYDRVAVVESDVVYGKDYSAKNITGKNIVNIFAGDVALGYYVNQSTGALAASATYNCTGFFLVEPNKDYVFSRLSRLAWYDKSKTFISGLLSGPATVTSPYGAYYCRVSVLVAQWSTLQVEQATVSTDFEDYRDLEMIFDAFPQEVVDRAASDAALQVQLDVDAVQIKLVKDTYTKKTSSSVNLFNKDDVTPNYVNWVAPGNLIASGAYSASDYIEVEENTQYAKNGLTHIAFYDSAKVFISGNASVSSPFTTPAGCQFLRVDNLNGSLGSAQLQLGPSYTGYEAWAPPALQTDDYEDLSVTNRKLSDGIEPLKISAFEIGENKLNIEVAIEDFYVNWTNGTLGANAGYWSSDYIAIEENTDYAQEYNTNVAFYDSNKIFISGQQTPGKIFTTPAGAAFLRKSIIDAYYSAAFLIQSSTEKVYVPYIEQLKTMHLPPAVFMAEVPDIIIPPEFYLISGREISIYFDNIIAGKAIDYNWAAIGSYGEHQDERWTATTETPGSGLITIAAYNKGNETVVSSASTTLIVKDETAGNAVSKKVLVIGDSTTANGTMITELNSLFSSDVMSINCIGTRGSGAALHEGVSGWTASKHFTDPTSAFVFGGVFDFSQFVSTNGFAGCDIVIINLGINDVFAQTTDEGAQAIADAMIAIYESMITSIQAYNASCLVGIAITNPPGSSQDAFATYGSHYQAWRFKRNLNILGRAFLNQFSGRTGSGVHLVGVNCNIDTVHNWTVAPTPANSRTSTLVDRQSNSVHPGTTGYYQIADTIYSFIKGQET